MRTTVKYLLLTLLFAALLPVDVLAKRVEPQPVKPIFFGSYKIHATGSGSSGNVIVSKKCKCKPQKIVVYEINYIQSLESDVQSLYITKLEFSKDLLLIKTENDGIFSCDITNGKVKTIKTPQGYRILKSDKTPVQLEKIWIKTK
jgi:hypothetical protein